MAKVKLLKDHLHHKQGEEIEVHEDRAVYFERCGVAEKQNTSVVSEKKKQSGPAKNEKKKQSGPNA